MTGSHPIGLLFKKGELITDAKDFIDRISQSIVKTAACHFREYIHPVR